MPPSKGSVHAPGPRLPWKFSSHPTLGECNQLVRELSFSFPLSHHVWCIGGDNVGLIQSTKAPALRVRLQYSEYFECFDLCREDLRTAHAFAKLQRIHIFRLPTHEG